MLDSTLRLHGSEEGGSYFLGGFYSVAEVRYELAPLV